MSLQKKAICLDVAQRNKLVRDLLKTLEFNKVSIRKSIDEITVVETKLEGEKHQFSQQLDQRVRLIRETLDIYIEKLKAEFESIYKKSLQILIENKRTLVQKLECSEQDIIKCRDILKGNGQNSELKVSKEKVTELMTESLDKTKCSSPKIELCRANLKEVVTEKDVKLRIENIIGTLRVQTETFGEIRYPGNRLQTNKTSQDEEINTISVPESGIDAWLNFGVSNELTTFNYQTESNSTVWKTVGVSFKINDIAVTSDGRIFATSPDSKFARCLRTLKSGGHVQVLLIEDDLFLHSLTLCSDNKKLAICGTDTKNYSSDQPNEVVIIEYTIEGKELKRTAVSGYSGKVYRIAQNMNGSYVLTFPKEGFIIAVNAQNGSIMSSFDQEDFKQCRPKSIKALGSEFWPSGVCCSYNGFVFISEYVNKLILMLDEDFRFLRFIGERYVCPNALAFQNETGTLWIGDKGTIHVWKMIEII